MIKKILLPIIAIILLSSCANKFSLQKRKYNKGFYFANSKNSNHNTNHVVTNAKSDNEKKLTTKAHVQPKDDVNLIEADIKVLPTNKISSNKSVATNKKVQSEKNITASASKQNIVVLKQFKDLKLNNAKNKLGKAKKSNSDTNLIILVILCLFPFINLIAIYLKDSKSITLNFWITLILDILFFLPGIIFALLVVLDVVNLA